MKGGFYLVLKEIDNREMINGNLTTILNYRTLLAIILGFGIVSIIAPIVLPMLHKLKFGQYIREDGPKTHLKKAGTPTMGGIIFIIATTISMIIMSKSFNDRSMIALYAFIGFGFIGFLDDLLKIIHKNNLGLRAWQKMILLIIISIGLAYYAKMNIGTKMLVPFANFYIDWGILFIPAMIVYFAGATNAVNLTDGLDGLASSVTILVMTFFALVSFGMGEYTLAIFCLIIVGSLLGFLRYNAFPARVFMGDTGSLALGGAVSAVAMILQLEFLLIIVGGIYVIETLSVMIQVTSFKLTGKRVFKMAPIHHHFEQKGWSETKIVSVFSILTVAFCFIAFLAF